MSLCRGLRGGCLRFLRACVSEPLLTVADPRGIFVALPTLRAAGIMPGHLPKSTLFLNPTRRVIIDLRV